ncbi:MAG: dihydroorotase [Ignavibacteriaceae bacterium]
MKIALKNIIVFNPEQNLNKKTSLVIENGIIIKMGNLTPEDSKTCKVYDYTDKYCSPGFFDMHVHLREPGREDKETIQTGTLSAANGGYTGIACMPNTTPAIDSAEVVLFIKEKAKNSIVDVFPIAAVTIDRKGELLSPMAELFDAGAVAFSDDGTAVKSSRIMRTALEYAKMFNLPVIDHCEDESLAGGAMNESFNSTLLGLPPIPSVAEDIIVSRDMLLAEYLDAPVHIAHISTKRSVELVRAAKKRGVKVTTEVTPHHFTLTDDAVKTYDTNTKMNPPLRTNADLIAILEGLKDGTIDCIASDHAPHAIEEKEVEFEDAPNGIVGLETQVGLAFTELFHKKVLSLEELIKKLAINSRKILNIPVPKIEVGAEANLTIFDPDEIWTVELSKFKSKSKNSPFNKRLLQGKALAVINKGKMYSNGTLTEI